MQNNNDLNTNETSTNQMLMVLQRDLEAQQISQRTDPVIIANNCFLQLYGYIITFLSAALWYAAIDSINASTHSIEDIEQVSIQKAFIETNTIHYRLFQSALVSAGSAYMTMSTGMQVTAQEEHILTTLTMPRVFFSSMIAMALSNMIAEMSGMDPFLIGIPVALSLCLLAAMYDYAAMNFETYNIRPRLGR